LRNTTGRNMLRREEDETLMVNGVESGREIKEAKT